MDEEYIRKNLGKILCGAFMALLLILMFGTYLEKAKLKQYSELLQQQKFKYKKQIQKLEKERDELHAKLAPFLARADYGFPEAPSEDRLNLLIMKMDETNFAEKVDKPIIDTDRVISKENRFYISNGLKFLPKLELEITYPDDDPESHRLAAQIQGIFEAADWPAIKVYPSNFSTPVQKMTVEFGEKPDYILQRALLPLFDSLGYSREAFLNVNLPKNTMKIIVGKG